MNSLLFIALAAPAILANPVQRQVVSSSILTGTPTPTLTVPLSLTTPIASSDLPTPTEEPTIPLSTLAPVPTGRDTRGYWYCYFPGFPSGPPTNTDTYTDTYTGSYTDTYTDTLTTIDTETFSATDSTLPTEVPTDTATSFGSEPTITVTAVTDSDFPTATDTDAPTATDTDAPTDTDVPTATDTLTEFPTATDTFPITSDFPTPTPTAPGHHGVSTFTVVGPTETQYIECIRIPRWGPPRPHHPPHHTSGIPTSYVPTFTNTASFPVPTVEPSGTSLFSSRSNPTAATSTLSL